MNEPTLELRGLDALPDHELVDLVRQGDARAYAPLWRRHAGAAYSVAHSFRDLDSDDVVSEAFTRVLQALRAGGGPTGAFRPYLTVSVRNLARSLSVRTPMQPDIDLTLVADPTPGPEEAAARAAEDGATLDAFRSLPTRWQEVLWFSEVDGLKPRHISQYIGVPPNAVSALLRRARRGFRDAWISAQLAQARTPECRAAIGDMGAYTRGALTGAALRSFEAHLATCPTCPAALAEASRLSTLTMVLLPAVAGIGGAAVYNASLTPPGVPQALSADGVAVSDAPAPASDEDADSATTRRRGILALLVLLLLPLIGGVAVVTALQAGTTDGTRPLVFPTPAGPSPAPSPSVSPSVSPSGTSPAPSPVTDVDDVDDDGRAPVVRVIPDIGTPPTLPPTTVPPVTLTPPQDEPPLAAPTPTLTQPDARMYPRLRGQGAAPGASIIVRDESGMLIGTGTAGADGSWKVQVTAGAPGAHTATVQQLVGLRSSPTSAPLPYGITAPPAISAPLDGATVDAARFPFRFAAAPGITLQRQIMGQTPVQGLVAPASGAWNEYLSVEPGEHVLRVRFANVETGDFGPYVETRFTATSSE